MRTFPPLQHLNWDPDRAELRKFGAAMLIGFGIIGLLAALRHQELAGPTFVLWGVGVTLAAVSRLPVLGRVAYLAVYVASGLIGFVVSHVLLTLIFFLVFLPVGLLLRLSGRDLLCLRPENMRWVPHTAREDRRRYYRQY